MVSRSTQEVREPGAPGEERPASVKKYVVILILRECYFLILLKKIKFIYGCYRYSRSIENTALLSWGFHAVHLNTKS